jgi:spermidine synthase
MLDFVVVNGQLEWQGLVVNSVLHSEVSPFQKITILDTEQAGTALVLDQTMQTCSVDEAFYHEILVHVPMFSHPQPKQVLIVGGGDGGTLKEILRHRSVESVHMVEIDERVVELCNQYLPSLNCAGKVYRDPRVNLIFQDARDFIKSSNQPNFDIILLDSSDCDGLAQSLFSRSFISDCANRLNKNGILVTQSGSPTANRQLVRETVHLFNDFFEFTGCYLTSIPSYTTGYFTFSWASQDIDLKSLALEELKLRFQLNPLDCVAYNSEFHKASFVLPNWHRSLIS